MTSHAWPMCNITPQIPFSPFERGFHPAGDLLGSHHPMQLASTAAVAAGPLASLGTARGTPVLSVGRS
jgi:hypothetical protein